MTPAAMRLASVNGAELQVEATGTGEPVVLVQTALTADELRPLADQPALRNGYRKILYHRRGYAGSSPIHGPGSIVRDAADCHALLDALASSGPTLWGCPTAQRSCCSLQWTRRTSCTA